jgi:hypothetical protein
MHQDPLRPEKDMQKEQMTPNNWSPRIARGPKRTDKKKRIYPTDGDAGSLDARKEQMKRIDNTRQLELQDP